ncbi:hypothetical protein EOS_40975 [Caballeronia mineralivorans PML1(12)]|uniref:Uncharacterized protein n=1 Tax=Caballeronia mineralivorans PML1(12) TaxID=908627 RepID=A0A0J1CIS5_9BURK|nr:hypothetical protein EOS_40975 [Caballeronia mineralivorans PML1(12)]
MRQREYFDDLERDPADGRWARRGRIDWVSAGGSIDPAPPAYIRTFQSIVDMIILEVPTPD